MKPCMLGPLPGRVKCRIYDWVLMFTTMRCSPFVSISRLHILFPLFLESCLLGQVTFLVNTRPDVRAWTVFTVVSIHRCLWNAGQISVSCWFGLWWCRTDDVVVVVRLAPHLLWDIRTWPADIIHNQNQGSRTCCTTGIDRGWGRGGRMLGEGDVGGGGGVLSISPTWIYTWPWRQVFFTDLSCGSFTDFVVGPSFSSQLLQLQILTWAVKRWFRSIARFAPDWLSKVNCSGGHLQCND